MKQIFATPKCIYFNEQNIKTLRPLVAAFIEKETEYKLINNQLHKNGTIREEILLTSRVFYTKEFEIFFIESPYEELIESIFSNFNKVDIKLEFSISYSNDWKFTEFNYETFNSNIEIVNNDTFNAYWKSSHYEIIGCNPGKGGEEIFEKLAQIIISENFDLTTIDRNLLPTIKSLIENTKSFGNHLKTSLVENLNASPKKCNYYDNFAEFLFNNDLSVAVIINEKFLFENINLKSLMELFKEVELFYYYDYSLFCKNKDWVFVVNRQMDESYEKLLLKTINLKFKTCYKMVAFFSCKHYWVKYDLNQVVTNTLKGKKEIYSPTLIKHPDKVSFAEIIKKYECWYVGDNRCFLIGDDENSIPGHHLYDFELRFLLFYSFNDWNNLSDEERNVVIKND